MIFISNLLPSSLISRIEQKKVVVFLGAGVSLDILNNQGDTKFQDWNTLLAQIGQLSEDQGSTKGTALKSSIGAFETPLLLNMVEGIKKELPGEVWRTFLRDSFSITLDEVNCDSLDKYKLITAINTPLVITTNYDPLFELASSKKVKAWTQKNSTEINDLVNGELSENAIWHIHGHVDEVDSIILCSSDYERLYQNEESQTNFSHSEHLLKRIAEQYSFLFIGFSLEDEFVINLLKSVNDSNNSVVPPYYLICSDSQKENKKDKLDNLHVLPIKDYGKNYSELLTALSGIEDKSSKTVLPKISSVIANNLPEEEYLDTGFVGLERLNQCIEIKKIITNSRDFIFTIQGEGGVGKSAMARKIASLILEDKDSIFNNICWVSAKSEELTFEGTQEIKGAISTFEDMQTELINFYDPKCTENTLNSLLKAIKKNSLIILDNLETISEPNLDDFLSNLPLNCKVLITSRRAINKGLDYSPAILSPDDAISLVNNYFVYLGKESDTQLINYKYSDLVEKLHFNPLAIKWFIIGLCRGMEPDKLFKLHNSEVLNYCIKNIYETLSESGKAILDVLRLRGERYSYSKICFLTEKTYVVIEDIILDELFKQSLVNRHPIDNKYKIQIKPRVQSYLNHILPLADNFIKDVSSKENKLKGRLDHFITDYANIPYHLNTLSDVNEENLVSAIILHGVLKSVRKVEQDKLLQKIEEAKNNTPEYHECYRVEASVLTHFDQRYKAKQAFEIGLVKGGENSPQYLYHFAQFLMKKSNGTSEEIFQLLKKAFVLDANSQEVWLELCRAIMFKGSHSESRKEVRKILNSGIQLDQSILLRATDVLIQSYKREAETIDRSKFIKLIEDQLLEYFLIPRSLRTQLQGRKITEHFKEPLRKISSLRNSFSSKNEVNQLSAIEFTLKALVENNSFNSEKYTVTGFSKDGSIEAKKNKRTIHIQQTSWIDTFPNSLLLIGESIIEIERNRYKRFQPLSSISEISKGFFPAVIAYSESNNDLVFAHLLNGVMIQVTKVISDRKLYPGEPIIVTAIKSKNATDFIYQKNDAFLSIIKKDSESKLSDDNQFNAIKTNVRLTGKVDKVVITKGIAFITAEGTRYFLHSTKLLRMQLSELQVGDIVEFNVVKSNKVKELDAAHNVVVVEKARKVLKHPKKADASQKKSLKKTAPKAFQVIRKHGVVTKKNNATIHIKSNDGLYVGLNTNKRDAKGWDNLLLGKEVWFSIISKTDFNNKKARYITSKD